MKPSAVILLILGMTFVIDGVMAPFLTPGLEGRIGLLHGVIIGVACYIWCKLDAEERGATAPGRSAFWAGVMPIIGVPVYFFRTRPSGVAAVSTAKALGFVAALFALDIAIAEGIRALRT
jgi:hypothetical protein